MLKNSILVGMSGGVDSSVALLLLKREGYAVSGATIVMFDNLDIGLSEDDSVCGSGVELEAAKNLAEKLACPHYTVNGREDFDESVMRYFAETYERGQTPNPCAVCNKTVKFPKLFEEANRLGIEKIATGHYAKVEYDRNTNKYKLMRAADKKKDQSYFLYRLGQKELSRIVFPLGNFTKQEIRRIAASAGFESAEKSDSQDICFVKNRSYVDFLVHVMKSKLETGDFVSNSGEVLGKHMGFISYTVGQRKGLGMTFGKPMYVLSKEPVDKTIILGDEKELFKLEATVTDVNLISGEEFQDGLKVQVKPRSAAQLAGAQLFNEKNGNIRIVFDEPQRALAPGQSAVFYVGEEVLGGGTIL